MLLKAYQKWLLWYVLPISFKFFINVFAFLYVKANSKGFSFILFLMSAFWMRFKANDVKKMCSYPHFSLTLKLVEFEWKYPIMFKFIIIIWWDQVIAHNSAVYLNATRLSLLAWPQPCSQGISSVCPPVGPEDEIPWERGWYDPLSF